MTEKNADKSSVNAEKTNNNLDRRGLLRTSAGGLFPTLVHASSDLATKSAEASFGLVRECHAELFARTTGALDFVEEVQHGVLRILRGVVRRADHLTLAVLDASEVVASSALRTAHEAGDGMTDLANKTGDAVVSKRAAAAA